MRLMQFISQLPRQIQSGETKAKSTLEKQIIQRRNSGLFY